MVELELDNRSDANQVRESESGIAQLAKRGPSLLHSLSRVLDLPAEPRFWDKHGFPTKSVYYRRDVVDNSLPPVANESRVHDTPTSTYAFDRHENTTWTARRATWGSAESCSIRGPNAASL